MIVWLWTPIDAGDDEDGGVEDAEGAFGFGREVDVTGVSRG